MEHNISPLPNGTQVDEYIIDSVLGGGGFSIVYNAHLVSDENLTVIIKEFMPKKLAVLINKFPLDSNCIVPNHSEQMLLIEYDYNITLIMP